MEKLNPKSSNNYEAILETKRKEWIEEYKVLHSKIDSYGTVLIRVRSMILSFEIGLV